MASITPGENMDAAERICYDHRAHTARLAALELADANQWKACDELRRQVSRVIAQVAGIVGGITVLQTIAVAVIVYYLTKGAA